MEKHPFTFIRVFWDKGCGCMRMLHLDRQLHGRALRFYVGLGYYFWSIRHRHLCGKVVVDANTHRTEPILDTLRAGRNTATVPAVVELAQLARIPVKSLKSISDSYSELIMRQKIE